MRKIFTIKTTSFFNPYLVTITPVRHLLFVLLMTGGSYIASAQLIFQSAKQMGGTGSDYGNSIVLDGSGNVYTTGFFEAAVDFDPGVGVANLTSTGAWDVFINKLDASGNFLWAKKLGGVGNDVAYSIALDGSGNIYTTGFFEGTADFDPGIGVVNLTSAGGWGIFISKLDASGNFLWAKQLG